MRYAVVLARGKRDGGQSGSLGWESRTAALLDSGGENAERGSHEKEECRNVPLAGFPRGPVPSVAINSSEKISLPLPEYRFSSPKHLVMVGSLSLARPR